MKVLMVHNFYKQHGGEDTVFLNEVSLLKDKGIEVIVVKEENKNIEKTNQIKAAINTIWSMKSKKHIKNIIKKEKVDIVHVHNYFLRLSPSIYYACQELGVPVIQTLHNYRLICPNALLLKENKICEDCINKLFPWPSIVHGCWQNSRIRTAIVFGMLTFHRLLKTWDKQVDFYIALTEFAKRKFIEGGLPAEKILVKPNFIYPDPGVNRTGSKYALFVGRLSLEKGIITLLKAWLKLKENIPLLIVGDGPLSEQVYSLAKKHNSIKILGKKRHEEVINLMKGAAFLIFPSEWYEGFPMTIVEAFACGLPVIASRLGSMAEIIEENRTGVFFETGNIDDLSRKVLWAWNHREEMIKMGKEARKEYELKYTADKNYQMLMQIYKKAITQKRGKKNGKK